MTEGATAEAGKVDVQAPPPPPPPPGITIAEHANQPSVSVTTGGGGNGSIAKINLAIIRCLAGILVLFACYLVGLSVASWWGKADDPGGVNALREDIKTFVTFILGLFSGIVQARIIGKHQE
jgi:hypothetical protein